MHGCNQNIDIITDVYDSEASAYEGLYDDPVTRASDEYLKLFLEDQVMQLRHRFPGEKIHVLNIGCGTSQIPRGSTFFINSKIVSYLGVDFSKASLEEARHLSPSHFKFIEADMHDLSSFIPERSIDLLISLNAPISYAQDPHKVIKEAVE